jgi:hypothetical protein
MKFILHIKLPHYVSPENVAKLRHDAKREFGSNYVVVVTSNDIDIEVYPKFIYKAAMFVNKVKLFIVKAYNWICKPVEIK